MTPFRGLAILLFICLSLFFHDLARTDLWSSHEARAAQNAQRMIDDDAWALPRLYDNQPETQKPPAYYWMAAGIASFRDGVVDRWAVRLPAALAGLGTVLLVWWFLIERGRPVAGLVAGIVLATSIHFTSAARTGRIDMPLTFCVTASMFVLVSRMHAQIRIPIAGCIFAAALLLKGPIGLVLPTVAVTTLLAIQSFRWTLTDNRAWYVLGGSCVFALALALPWFFWVNDATHGDFIRSFFWHHHVERAMGTSASLSSHPFWYYLPRFALDFMPATPLLIIAMIAFVRQRVGEFDQEAALGLIWMTSMIALLSLSQFKRADYLLPAYPGAALLVGCTIERWHRKARANVQKLVVWGGSILVAGCLTGWWWFHHYEEPKMEAARAQQAFALYIREQAPAPQPILMFQVESHLLSYHLGRPIHTLVEWSELDECLSEPGTHWFVTQANLADHCIANVRSRRVSLVSRSENFSPAKPHRPLVLMRAD